jgi:hypothetical protein
MRGDVGFLKRPRWSGATVGAPGREPWSRRRGTLRAPPLLRSRPERENKSGFRRDRASLFLRLIRPLRSCTQNEILSGNTTCLGFDVPLRRRRPLRSLTASTQRWPECSMRRLANSNR